MYKQNCWEFNKCGREPGGKNVCKLGVCPAASNEKANGINSGKNGGRACWAIAGTLCKGTIQAGFPDKFPNCFYCSFYNKLLSEEGVHFVPSLEILELIESEHNFRLLAKSTSLMVNNYK